MPLPTASFIGGVLVLAYLSTFVLFALLRILTGVSVQRVGYTGFRRIAFSPRDGVKIYIRGIGLSLHRPTFAQPTWVSLQLTEPQVVLDLRALGKTTKTTQANASQPHPEDSLSQWKKLIEVKDKLKRLHTRVKYLSLVDLVAMSATFAVKEVGTITIERATLAVDTRAKTVDRSRLFQHDKTKSTTQTPAEWKSIIRSILFTPEGKESSEILDYLAFSVHGFLHPELQGLRDASISLKLGRLDIPYDELVAASERVKQVRGTERPKETSVQAPQIAVNDVLEDSPDPENRGEKLMQAVADSREFMGSVMRGIQEFQLAIGFLGLSKRIKSLHTSGQHVFFNLAMKELGLDLMRLDSRSPAHRMYFSPTDVAHQALLTAISISAGVDDGHDHPERILYVPMVTATIKTTLPSKTIQSPENTTDIRERNSNIFFANLVCTSPSIDLDPKHLPLLLAIAKIRESQKSSSSAPMITSSSFLSRLLPKAIVKIAIQEPVIRVSLPPLSPTNSGDVEYDLLISNTSTLSLDIDSQHSSVDSADKYSLNLNYRQTSSQLYYQTNAGDKHDLLQDEFIEIKVDVSVLPQPEVYVYGKFHSFSVFLVRTEISEGIRQIVKAARRETDFSKDSPSVKKPSFLRQVPAWLQHVSVQGSDFNVELAGVDPKVSKYSRGFALQLESWSAEYKAHREDVFVPLHRRRSMSRSLSRERIDRSSAPDTPRKKQRNPTDGRRLAVHVQGLEGHIIDTLDDSTAEPFIALPRFEVAFSTTTDMQGPLFHINSHAKSLQLRYSLYKHFSVGVAILTFHRMFFVPGEHPADAASMKHQPSTTVESSEPSNYEQSLSTEVTTLDFKSNLIQIKADLPSDPPMMIQIFGLDCGRHRWAMPFARVKVVRVLAGTPNILKVWSRIASVKNLRLDLREMKRKSGKQMVSEKSFDLTTDVIRLGVPHGMVLHSIFDNVANTIKTCEQLHHHFKTGSDENVLEKHAEGPKHVPRISLRSQLLLFEIEDSGFEWKLGTIHRAGLVEQQQRLAREEAFRLKVKSMETNRQRRGSSRVRTASAQPPQSKRNQSRPPTSHRRSKSLHSIGTLREESPEPEPDRGRGRGRIRYDTDGRCDMSGASVRTIEKAHSKLQEFNAQSWKKRIDRALTTQNTALKELRGIMWGMNDLPDESEQSELVMGIPQRPALMAACISDVGVIIDKPSFALEDCPKFLHDIGKGMPMDMKYGLLVPMSLKISMGEVRCTLRDYPLPFLHVPAIRTGQSPRLASLALSTDFVIAEEFQGVESQRHVEVAVVPKDRMGNDDVLEQFTVNVSRTISAVKTYSDMKIDINTSSPTRVTWGTSYQPVIQDMMQVIENFTKPPIDPSERVGFWDKIRLSFHSKIDVNWKGDGDVHLCLKGSRDPYVVTGLGAGFVMVWRNNVRWRIAQDDDPRKLMTVDSGDYVLAIPDYNHYARTLQDVEADMPGPQSSTSSAKSTAAFKKVVMKLSGNVQWMAGLTFEREVEGNRRSFDFCPHYKVKLRHPDYAKAPPGEEYDAFKNFRSHWIHGSIAISAPHNRNWDVTNLHPSKNYNSVHLTPRFFTHFFDWWSLFSGVMSLPVRQGPLWGSMEKSSKKFGRHLGTIKFNLLFSPLFISHIYKHKDAEDYQNDVVSATGLKMKLDSFMLDLHQRRETFEIPGTSEKKAKHTTAMKINQSQLDFIAADFRAVSASIKGTSVKDLNQADDATLASYQSSNITNVDMSKFTIPDNDLTWIDMDDFVELDWILPAESNPATKILPLGFAPRFTYFRQTDHGDSVSGDTTRSSIFGDEPTHFCVMSKRNDPRRVQADLIESRIHRIEEQMSSNERAVGEQHLKVVKDHEQNEALNERLRALRNHTETLQRKHEFLNELLNVLMRRLEHDDPSLVPQLETTDDLPDKDDNSERARARRESANMDSTPLADYTSDFNNRFVVHNAQIKWNNSLRNIILRYSHQVSQRRGFVYYTSRRAVKFILDILEEQKRSDPDARRPSSVATKEEPITPMSPDREDEMTIQDRIDQILQDGKQFVDADDPDKQESTDTNAGDGSGNDVSSEFTPQNTYHFRLIAPQIQLQSEKNPKSVVLVAAKGMQLKVIQIMDKERVMDEISGLVQRRFSAAMDSMQVFVASTKTFSTEYLHMYSGNSYGGKAGEYWPPWVPLEVMFEFQVNPYGFSRVVHRTSASLRYDKYNTLRLKYNDDVTGREGDKAKNPDAAENRMDHVYIEFPHFRAICDSNQYFAMYIIVLDLLLYSEPLEKTRSERLEKIMLASDFSDLTGAPEMVEMLQHRIRQLEDIKMHFQIHEKYLDRQGWKDRIALDADLANCEDELFFMMKAITTSQRRTEDRGQDESPGLLRWLISSKEIAWHLIRGKDESLLEFQLKDGLFDRTDNNDGSNSNCVEIGRVNGFNLLPNAVYPEIIAPYVDPTRGYSKSRDMKMIRVQWLMLEAIAGIPVVDYFEVNVMPLRVQLEREVAKKLFEYLFPGVGGNAFEGSGFSPFIIRNMALPEDGEELDGEKNDTKPVDVVNMTQDPAKHQGVGTGAGELEHRLQPTLKLTETKPSPKAKNKGLGINNTSSHTNLHSWNPFQHSDRSSSALAKKQNGNGNASSNVSLLSRTPSQRSSETNSLADTESAHKKRSKKKEKDPPSDDLTQMMARASNYMTLAFFKIPSMVLCLSYKGRGQRNLEDVHDLVFRLPTLEYRNKTWSNLDLALQLKKDLIKALISHAGAIVGNKFSHHRPSRQAAASRLREIANMSTMKLGGEDQGSEASSSLYRESPIEEVEDDWDDDAPPRPSFTSGRASTFDDDPLSITRTKSVTPSLAVSMDSDGPANRRPATSYSAMSRSSNNRLDPSMARRSEERGRSSSISSKSGGFLNRLRPGTSGGESIRSEVERNGSVNGNNGEDTDESTKLKSKLLLGGQKFLRSLPHGSKGG